MNLHGIAALAVSAVNPQIPVVVQVCSGYTTGTDGKRVPTYEPQVTVPGQVQNLTYSDLHQIEGLNLQGIRRAIYLNGRVDGLVRVTHKGGDLITIPANSYGPDTPMQIWLVAHVLEYWPDWCKVAATLQNGS